MYEIKGLTKKFSNRTVVDIEELFLEKEKIFSLLGPNGAGKSTLLSILGFLSSPDSGEIMFMGQKITYTQKILLPLRKRVVFVDQNPILFTGTVKKNLEFGLKIRKLDKKEMDKRVAHSLELVGLQDYASMPAHRLSGGETKRAALARAIALSPEVMLCDEPTASVDPENQESVNQAIKIINQENKVSILFTTHDRFHAFSLTNDIMYLNAGKISRTPPENMFFAEAKRIEPDIIEPDHIGNTAEGGSLLSFKNGIELIADIKVSGSIRAHVDPAEIEILATNESKISINLLKGRIAQIALDNDGVRLSVDVGMLLTVFLDLEKYRMRHIKVGDIVNLNVKPCAIKKLK